MRWLAVITGLLPTFSLAQSFVDVAPELGIDGSYVASGMGIGCGVSWTDINNDGKLDLIVTGANSIPKLHIQGDGTFTVDEDSLLPNTAPGYANGHVVFDMDNDGDSDVLLLRRGTNALMRNDGNSFTDVSATHLPGNAAWSVSAAAGDFDGDGDTDIYVGNYITSVAYPTHNCTPNILMENDGKGRFTSGKTSQLSIKHGCTLATAMSDYDNDGDLDLIGINDFGNFNTPNELYRNDGLLPDGSWKFTDVSKSSGFDIGLYGMGVTAADINSDGWLDYFITNIGRPTVLLGSSNGTFTDGTAQVGADIRYADTGWQVTWGSVIEDLNGDGWMDLFAAGGHVEAIHYLNNQLVMPNLLLVGNSTGTWQDNPPDWNIPALSQNSARSVAAEDYDNDGRVDLAVSHINGLFALYNNTSTAPPAMRITPRPQVTGSDAAGVHIKATCGGHTRIATIMAGGAYAGTPSRTARLTFPKPCNEPGKPVIALIRWPSGYVQKTTLSTGSEVTIDEPNWLELSAEKITMKLTNDQGEPLTEDDTVIINAVGATVSKPVFENNDSFTASISPLAESTNAVLSIVVNGTVLAAHPRLSWPKPVSSLIRLSPQHIIAGQPYEIFVNLYGADGTPAITEDEVTVKVGDEILQTELLGAGTYTATGKPLAQGPITIQPMLLGENYGQSIVKTVEPPFDLNLSDISVHRLPRLETLPPDEPLEPVLVFIKLFDANGFGVEPAPDNFKATINGKTVDSQNILKDGLEMLAAFSPSVFPPKSQVVFSYLDIPLMAPQTAHVFTTPTDVAAIVDPKTSHCTTSMMTMKADGADIAILAVFLRDSSGNPIPGFDTPPNLMLTNLNLVPESVQYTDDRWEMTVRSGTKAGTGKVNVMLGAAELGVNCEVSLTDPGPTPTELDPELSFVEVKPDILPADGLATAITKAFPRLPSGRLAGSGLSVEMKATLGKFSGNVEYNPTGRYEATLVPEGQAGISTITASITTPFLQVSTEATFFADMTTPDNAQNPEHETAPDETTPSPELTSSTDVMEPGNDLNGSTGDTHNSSDGNTDLHQHSPGPEVSPRGAPSPQNTSGGCHSGNGSSQPGLILGLLLLLVALRTCNYRGHA